MDRSEVQALVERELTPLCRRLGINHWTINTRVVARPVDEDTGCLTRGECTRLVDYDTAYIELNAEGFESAEQALCTLRHELFHIVLAPFDILTNVFRSVIKDDAKLLGVMQSVQEHAVEQAVINLNRMYLGLTQPCPQADQDQDQDQAPPSTSVSAANSSSPTSATTPG